MEASIKTFLGAIVFGMGFHVGWGLITLLVWALSAALGQSGPPMLK